MTTSYKSSQTPIDFVASKTFGFLRHLTLWGLLRCFLRRRWAHFRFRGEFTEQQWNDPTFSMQRSWVVDIYVLAWILSGMSLFAWICFDEPTSMLRCLILFVAAIRLTETVQSPVNTLVFDYARGRSDSQTASTSRLLVLSFINVAEFALWFAIVYALNLHSLIGASSKSDALYFSVMTQFTVGYGDIHPDASLKWLAMIQVLLSFVLVVLVVARAVTALPPLKGFLDRGQAVDDESAP